MKATSVDDIVAKFSNKTLPKIDGEPDYEAINQLIQMLYGNAATLPTTLGGGQHGHVGILMKDTLYHTLSATPYVTPIDPGASAQNIPAAASVALRQQLRDEHVEQQRIYQNHINMDDALKTQLIDAVDEPYISELRNKYTGFMGITTRDMVDHLLDRYGKITPADLKDNERRMNEPLDGSQPIDIFFKRIDNAVQYADDGNTPYTPQQILQTVFHAVNATGMYKDACKEWRKKPVASKTWTTFKIFSPPNITIFESNKN